MFYRPALFACSVACPVRGRWPRSSLFAYKVTRNETTAWNGGIATFVKVYSEPYGVWATNKSRPHKSLCVCVYSDCPSGRVKRLVPTLVLALLGERDEMAHICMCVSPINKESRSCEFLQLLWLIEFISRFHSIM